MDVSQKSIDDASTGLKRIMEYHKATYFKLWLASGSSGVRVDRHGSKWIFITQRQIEKADECIKNGLLIPDWVFEPSNSGRRSPGGKSRPRRR